MELKNEKTHEEFKKEVYNLVGDEYTVNSNYKNNNSKIKFTHNTCGKSFEMKPSNFISLGQRCPHCNSNLGKIKLEDANKAFLKKGLTLLEKEYKNSRVKMKFKCNKCGNESFISYSDLVYKNNGCSQCSGNKRLLYSDIKQKIEETGKYNLLTDSKDYKNVHSKLTIQHECGFIYRNSFNNFRNGQRCPLCENKNMRSNLSKGVRKIIDYLIENKIGFEREVSFNDLIDKKRKLRIDFYIPSLNIYIEYNGKQHYEYSNDGIFTEEKYLEILESDTKKYNYFKEKSLTLEIIKYDEDIKTRLNEIILKYKKI